MKIYKVEIVNFDLFPSNVDMKKVWMYVVLIFAVALLLSYLIMNL